MSSNVGDQALFVPFTMWAYKILGALFHDAGPTIDPSSIPIIQSVGDYFNAMAVDMITSSIAPSSCVCYVNTVRDYINALIARAGVETNIALLSDIPAPLFTTPE